MKQSLILLIALLIRIVALAQPVTTANTSSRSTNGPAMQEMAPRATKATESPFYVKLYGIYGLLTPGVQINHSELQTQSGSVSVFKTTNKGLGAGPRAGVGLGFIVSDFINLGVDADILFGTAVKFDNSYTDGIGTYGNSTTTTLKVVSVIPNITFKALSRPAYYIYNRLGLVGGMVLDFKQVDSGSDVSKTGIITSKSVATSKYTQNSLALGYQAALGIQFRLTQSLRGFAEVVAYNQSFKPEKLELNRISTAGTKVTTAFNTTVFKEQGTSVGATSTKTGQQQSFNVPINSVGVGVGLSFRF